MIPQIHCALQRATNTAKIQTAKSRLAQGSIVEWMFSKQREATLICLLDNMQTGNGIRNHCSFAI